jgi:heptosyltransferase-3
VSRIDLPARPRILVIALRRLGDVLLTTPLIRSLKRAWPGASIDVLVFEGTAGILAGNPDIANVIGMPQRPGVGATIKLLARLWKRYDLAVSTQTGDRPTLFAMIAGSRHAGLTDPNGPRLGSALKRFFLGRSIPATGNIHRVEQMLRLADALDIARVAELVCPAGVEPKGIATGEAYAVIHAAPMFRYKEWTREGWHALAAGLARTNANISMASGKASCRCIRCAGRRRPLCSSARASMSGRTLRSRIWQRRLDVRRWRCLGRWTRACGGRSRSAG